jgi:hypothetical protein
MGLRSSDALWDLIDRYDVSNVEIGFIRFEGTPSETVLEKYGRCLIFASVDADFLASAAESGKVLSLDGCNMPYVMGVVAEDGGRFLDTLIEMIEAARRKEDRTLTARRCATMSGAEEALGFFESIM